MSIQVSENRYFIQVQNAQQATHLPTKEQAQKVFRQLGDNFWHSFIEAAFIKHGYMVFDEGLHGGNKEPGFFASLKRGYDFAAEHLTEPTSPSFYKELHTILCAHFKGKENNTLMDATQAGEYRHTYPLYEFNISTASDEARQHYGLLATEQLMQLVRHWETMLNSWTHVSAQFQSNDQALDDQPSVTPLAFPDPVQVTSSRSEEWIAEWENQWGKKVIDLQHHIKTVSKELEMPTLCSISLENQKVKINYTYSVQEIEKIVPKLFHRYEKKITEINAKAKDACIDKQLEKFQREKISAIAELFQLLEWIHPFPDGQGRTDLVLLAKLLTEQGFNPPILENSYFSSVSFLSEWEDYLSKGVDLWKEQIRGFG